MAALVASSAGGCVACYRALDRAFMEQNLPKVTHGQGRTAELEAELRSHGLELPAEADDVTYTITSSWDLNRVAVRFVLPSSDVAGFVDSLSVDATLEPGLDPWEYSFAGAPEHVYGWVWPLSRQFAGLELQNPRRGEIRYALAIAGPDTPRPVVYLEGAR